MLTEHKLFLFTGNVGNFDKPFEGSITDVKGISLSIYSALFSYAGWYVCDLDTSDV